MRLYESKSEIQFHLEKQGNCVEFDFSWSFVLWTFRVISATKNNKKLCVNFECQHAQIKKNVNKRFRLTFFIAKKKITKKKIHKNPI